MAMDDAEKAPPQPAAPAPENKTEVPKVTAPSFVSTFINKDTSGKKVAPKAVRRRGGAAAARPADTPATQASAITSTPSAAAPAAVEPSNALPTPAATQEVHVQDVSHIVQRADITTPPSVPTPAQITATPPPTAPVASASQREASPKRRRGEEEVAEAEHRPEAASFELPPTTSVPSAPANDSVESARSPKRRRIERVPDLQAGIISRPTPDRSQPRGLPNQDADSTQSLALGRVQVPVEDNSSPIAESDTLLQASADRPQSPEAPRTRVQEMNEGQGTSGTVEAGTETIVVNSSTAGTSASIDEQETRDEAPAVQPPASDGPVALSRGRRASKAVGPEKDAEGTVAGPRRVTRPKGRGAVEEETESPDQANMGTNPTVAPQGGPEQVAVDEGAMEWAPAQPPKKARKPRKDKGTKRKGTGALSEGDTDIPGPAASAENVTYQVQPTQRRRATRKRNTIVATADAEQSAVDEGTEPTEENRPARRKTTTKRRQAALADANADRPNAENGVQAQPARRRGRQRESTPSDAEKIRIDEESTFMASVAAVHFRTGKLSRRERAMREINWEEVKERRRKEEALGVPRLSKRSEVDEELNRAAEAYSETHHQVTGPRYEVVDGEIVVVETSATVPVDVNGEEIDAREVVEEGDLTARITTRSFLREGKRFPEQFMLPGQGTRWNRELTERFYDALQTFGTDFGMISTLFPGSTRRSIKLKFNREEKENPAGIKAALNGQRNSNWDDYLKKSGMTDDHFLDPKAIEEELNAERERMQVEIDAARAAAEEERRQRRIAGAELSEEEDAGQADGGKKKRRKREKKVVFQDAGNVEILGEIGDEEEGF
ncbi:uncharacterized protein EI97DRAFT_503246 [Westerdykella ornata]|uniref:Transcription factor TFIIIB component B'' Myb domain-containing protein n=1 Tax=Westerdykella ornata TaxID=318751 RepID=A0A6A6JC60_WESOR|nr:uncharacterized protein EI97DRAFT_503246 [Westerdykella ornata]KAF2273865.1 hypothetical protein EI97DRAFT_503246 [Westerdykella ornata]